MLRETKPWSKVSLRIRGNAPNPAKLCVTEFINCPYRVGSKVLSQVSDIVDLAHRTSGCSSDFSAWVLLETRTWNTNKDVSHLCVDSITFVENSPYQAFLPSPVCSPAQVYVESRKQYYPFIKERKDTVNCPESDLSFFAFCFGVLFSYSCAL